MRLVASKGLGDAIYLRAAALHLMEIGQPFEIYTGWPDVFTGLPNVRPVSDVDDRGDFCHVAACNCRNPEITKLDQFTNAYRRAGIEGPVKLQIGWTVRNAPLVAKIREQAAGLPILVYQPVKKANNHQQQMLRPDRLAFNRLVGEQAGHYRVKLGHPRFVEDDKGVPCDLDLFGKTTVSDLLDIATEADLVVSEPCYLAILAQALDKTLICMFSSRALASRNVRIASIRPERIFHKPHLAKAAFDG